MELTLPQRWLDPEAYDKAWGERSELLLQMFAGRQNVARDWSFSEYGCGVHSPFFKAAEGNPGYTVHRYDMKSWTGDVRVCDLNTLDFEVSQTDVCVLSGVCEYLDQIDRTLQRLNLFHDHFLLSYAVFPSSDGIASLRRNTNEWTVDMIRQRAVTNGWRNHHTLREFVEITSTIGHISDIRTWADQVLVYVHGR